jgi:alpha-tubulin suppressor-like RCC1 family protein
VATQVVSSVPDGGPPVYLTGAIHISTASDTQYTFPTCAIRSDRTVWCWGASTAETGGPDGLFWGTTGSTQSLDVATPIAASASDGGPPPTVLADQISVGFRHACILANGKVSCWGQNVAGNLGIGNASLTFQAYPAPVMAGLGLPATVDEIGSGFDFSCARAGGGVWCWGASGQPQVGNPGVPPSICNSNYCVPVPAPVQQSAKDGGLTVVPDGGTDQSPLVGAVSIHVGYLFACALDASGTAWCWGASGGAVAYESEATPYTSTQVPYSGINELTLYGEESSSGLRYLTASGQYVSGNQVVTPFCQ